MKRVILLVVALWAAPMSLSWAQPVVVADPARHVTELSNNMSVAGVAPLRALYSQMYSGAALPSNVEAALLTYERAITSPRALESRIIEDITLSDAYRAIFLYHYYGSNAWIFIRLDFVRIGPEEWTVSAATFGSEWTRVAIPVTPGFTSNLGSQR
ncbi:MAG TPA: hypothetical protein VEA80_05740 [Vitreimonas sp.]|nr:hypothetical protein [Vitreimonas sp.]